MKKALLKGYFTLLLILFAWTGSTLAEDINPLEIGAAAPDFELVGVDDQVYTLASFADADILAVVFTCNHCPTAQAYEQRLIDLTTDYQDKGVAVVAISPNDPRSVRLDELGYSDLNDSLEEMKHRAEEMGFNFPYLYDGDVQEVSKAYGPQATPHVFIFDQARILRYAGRIDDNERIGAAQVHDTRNALDALLAGNEVAVASTKTFGCSVKWADKSGAVEAALARWEAEPVSVEMIDLDGIAALVANDTRDLRVINIWATWCGPCVVEFPELVDINRMYRGRRFEFVAISMDSPDYAEDVEVFLNNMHASNTNYHYNSTDRYAFIEALDPEWSGALPYTMLVAPGGEVVFRQQGMIDPLQLKKEIVGYLGRYYE